MFLRILQWNCRSITGKLPEFSNFCKDYDVICLQETWLHERSYFSFKEFLVLRSDRFYDAIGGGTAILCRKELDPVVVDFSLSNNPGIELSCISISCKNISPNRIFIFSLYKPPHIHANSSIWTNLFNSIALHIDSQDVLICGDFNTQHEIWGSSRSNRDGVALADALAISNFVFLNNGSPTRVSDNPGSRSSPDVTLVSQSFCHVCSWNTLDEPYGSDHFPIIIQLYSNSSIFKISNRSRMNIQNLDKEKFYDLVHKNMENLSVDNLLGALMYEHWNSIIIDCALRSGASILDSSGCICYFDSKTDSCKSYRPKPLKKRLNKPWWDRECDEAVAFRKRAFKDYKSVSSKQNIDIYNRCSNVCRKIIRKRKKVNFISFINDLNDNFNTKTFWDSINSFKNSAFFSKCNLPSESKISSINSYINNFSPPWVSNSFEDTSLTPHGSIFDDEFFLSDLKSAIISSKVNSAPGPDLISNHLLRLLPESALIRLLKIFNRIMLDGSFPVNWRFFDVVLIPKPNKSDFRPISLASCVLKVLEKMIKFRFEKFIELDLILPNCQFGFRRGKSCDDCLAFINLEIYKSFAKRAMTGALFLDIKSAYDNVNPHLLFSYINKLCIPNGYKNFFRNLLSPRTANFFESGISYGCRLLQRGIPQGSVLSPILFNIFVKDILFQIPHNIVVLQYADDIAILLSDSALSRVIDGLKSVFNQLSCWLESLNLSISLQKTQFIIFHRKRSLTLPTGLECVGGFIPISSYIRYLGLIMDMGLRWAAHIKSLKDRSLIYVNILKWLTGRTWGISPVLAINYINATIGAILEWGAMWFISAAKTHLSVIESILCSSYKIALNIPRSSSNRACWAFSDQRSFLRRIIFKCDKYLCKSIQLRNFKFINKIVSFHASTLRYNIPPSNIPFILSRWPIIQPYKDHLYVWNIHPSFSYPPHIYSLSLDIDTYSGSLARDNTNPNLAFSNLISIKRISSSEIDVFTDGSKSDLSVGCAFYIPQFGITKKYKLSPYTSSFSAEIFAIIKFFDLLLEEPWVSVNICTDSLSFLQAIHNSSPCSFCKLSPLLADLRSKMCLALTYGKVVRFTWCPAHKGIVGNERADVAAKDAAVNGVYLNNKSTTLLDSYKRIDCVFLERINIGSGKFYMENFFELKYNVHFLSRFNLGRRWFGILSRIIVGYAFTNATKFKFGLCDSPECSCGSDFQDLNHLFWACELYNKERESFVESLFKLNLFAPFSVIYLFSNMNRKIVKAIICFISECKFDL